MGGYLALIVFVCLVVQFSDGYAMQILQQTSSIVADDADLISQDGLSKLLELLAKHERTLTLDGGNDVTDDTDVGVYDGDMAEKACSKGKCKLCRGGKFLKLCVIAEVIKNGFSASVTVNGKSVAKTTITVPNPKPICVNSIPGVKSVSNLCVQLTKINLKTLSGCLDASFKAKIGPTTRTIKMKLGCFTIPKAEVEETSVPDEDESAASVGIFEPETELAAGEVPMTSNDVEMVIEALLEAIGNSTEDEIDELLKKSCSKGHCHFCTPGKYLRLCVDAGILPKKIGFEITVTINGHRVYHNEISVANPPPICFNNLPVLKKITNVCLEIYDVNLQKKSACARVSFKVLKVKTIKLKLGCFHIPVADDVTDTDDAAPVLTMEAVSENEPMDGDILRFESNRAD